MGHPANDRYSYAVGGYNYDVHNQYQLTDEAENHLLTGITGAIGAGNTFFTSPTPGHIDQTNVDIFIGHDLYYTPGNQATHDSLFNNGVQFSSRGTKRDSDYSATYSPDDYYNGYQEIRTSRFDVILTGEKALIDDVKHCL